MRRSGVLCALCLFGIINAAETQFNKPRENVGARAAVERAEAWENRVYLATYPRSGNHWLRFLIEEATGIATSSVYKDPDPAHLTQVFPWGGRCCQGGYEGHCRYPNAGEIAVVKTHFPALRRSPFDELPYTRVVRMFRHPLDSFYSLYSYRRTFLKFPVENFIPRDELDKHILGWRKFQEHWDAADHVLTVRYEDFYQSPIFYLTQILEHIGYQVSRADVERAVAKYPPKGGLLKYLDHYSEDDLIRIQNKLGHLMKCYGYTLTEIHPIPDAKRRTL